MGIVTKAEQARRAPSYTYLKYTNSLGISVVVGTSSDTIPFIISNYHQCCIMTGSSQSNSGGYTTTSSGTNSQVRMRAPLFPRHLTRAALQGNYPLLLS